MLSTLIHKGIQFDVEILADDSQDLPWECEDGHGPVRKSSRPHGRDGDKRPSERPLNQADRHEYQFYYDWQAATRLANRDGWNAAPNRIQRAVQSDFDRLRHFLSGYWCYVGVRVTHQPSGVFSDLWRIESDCEDFRNIAKDLADECLASGDMASWMFNQASALCSDEV